MPNHPNNFAVTVNAEFSYYAGNRPGQCEKALDGITLEIEQGEYIAIVGRNGSGKSTLARMLSAQFLPTAGTARISGIDTRDGGRVWDVRKCCGMVFQDPDNQIIGITVEEDTAFGPENLGISPDEIRVRVSDALRTVSMADHADSAPHLLSGGEKQRVALAGILAMKPKCIILDEVTTMLDPAARESVMGLFLSLNREEKITVLNITNRMDEAALADRVVVMDAGRVVLDGKPGEVFSDPSPIYELGLELPPVAELLELLGIEGISLPRGITDPDEAIRALVALDSDGGCHVH